MSLFGRKLSLASQRASKLHKHTFYIYESRSNASSATQTLLYFVVNETNGDLRIRKISEKNSNKSRSPTAMSLSQPNLKYVNNVKNIQLIIESIEYIETDSVRLIIQFHNVLNIGNKKTKRGKCWDILFKHASHRQQCIKLLCRISLAVHSTKLSIKQERMKRPKQWISDSTVKHCSLCKERFTAMNRRHHCRSCGRVFCHQCSSETAVLPDLGIRDIVRVCDICYKHIIHHRMRSRGLLSNEELYRLDCSVPVTIHNGDGDGNEHNDEQVDDDKNDSHDITDGDAAFYGVNREWRRFVAHHYGDKLDPFDDELQELIRNGIPSVLRGYIWRNMISFTNLTDFQYDYYDVKYVDDDNNEKEEIYTTMEKDLQRTFPIHEIYKQNECVNVLRNILRKYSARNAEIGYCQSMNFLGAVLLLFLNETDSFWFLSFIIEKICCLFDEYFYHQADILGVKIDGFVFNDIIKEYLPDLYQHLINIDGTDNKHNSNFNAINNLTFHWFLSLFINTLSYKCLLQIWDNMICYDNINVIFRAALSILKMKSSEIMKCKEFYQIHDVLSNKSILTDHRIQNDAQFMKICIHSSDFKDIEDFILKQRMYHRNRLDDDYIGSQLYNDMEINLISEYANHNRMDSHSFIPRAKTTLTADLFFDDDDSLNDERIDTILAFHDTKHVHKHNNNNENDNDGNGNSQNVDGQKQENENNNNNSWILYNNAKSPRLPVSVQTFNPETPRRSLSNLASKQSKRSSDKNLNTSNGEKYYFQSDDNDSIDNIRNSGKHDEDNEEEETCMNAKNSSVHYEGMVVHCHWRGVQQHFFFFVSLGSSNITLLFGSSSSDNIEPLVVLMVYIDCATSPNISLIFIEALADVFHNCAPISLAYSDASLINCLLSLLLAAAKSHLFAANTNTISSLTSTCSCSSDHACMHTAKNMYTRNVDILILALNQQRHTEANL